MIKKLYSYIEANFGNIESIKLNEEQDLDIKMKNTLIHDVMVERIMDNFNWIEGLEFDCDKTVTFQIDKEIIKDLNI